MLPKKDDAPDKRRYLSSAARKEEILDAALVEFVDRTYNAVSTVRRNQDRKAPDIARRQSWVRVVGSGSS